MAVATVDALCTMCRGDSFFQNIHYKRELIKLLANIKDEFDIMRYFIKYFPNKMR